MTHRTGRIHFTPVSLMLLAFCAAFVIWSAAYPFSRAFFLAERDFNEGWNVYNTQKVAEHQLLYPKTYDWTAVNYPALSFHIVAALGHYTSEYLFTARLLSLGSLLLSALLVGLIVWHATRNEFSACFAGMFLVAVFCTVGADFVGMDDPQMFAQVFFLAGLYVYLRGGKRGWAIDLTALLFVLGGNIKRTLIEFPVAVLLDLIFSSPRKAARFAIAGLVMVAASLLLTSHIDGPAYISSLLTPREYSGHKAISTMYHTLRSTLLPTLAAFWTSRQSWRSPSERVLVLLLFCSLAVGTFFSGGDGVANNMMFGYLFSIVLLTGIFCSKFMNSYQGRFSGILPSALCTIFFLGLAITFVRHRDWHSFADLKLSRAHEQNFSAEVAYLRKQPGPALCESPLVCFYANKPYLYDAFNAERFIKQGKLDANVIVDHLRRHEYGAVQMYEGVESESSGPWITGEFAPSILQSIQRYYRPVFKNPEGIVYIPR